MKKRSTNEIKKMIILLIVMIVIVLIALIVFLCNVKIDNTSQNQITDGTDESNDEYSYYKIDKDNIDGDIENVDEDTRYDLVVNDPNGIFQIKLSNENIYFKVLDEDRFKEKYSNSKLELNKEKEISIHDYKIIDVHIGDIGDDTYLLALTEDGSIGIMNIDEAIEKDVFRIKNELLNFETGVTRIENVQRVNDFVENTIIVVTSDGKNYDLEAFI